MAKVRPAVRCKARRTDGQPCSAWAVTGGTVCSVHGGTAPQVREAANLNRIRRQVERAADRAMRRHEERMLQWRIRRVMVTSDLLGIPPARVTLADILTCIVLHGVPNEPEPKLVDSIDRRYGPRLTRRT